MMNLFYHITENRTLQIIQYLSRDSDGITEMFDLMISFKLLQNVR